MSDSYFVRIRGRVQGPFDVEKLQTLAQRGQLSRMHELSPDGAEWMPAGSHSELFTKSSAKAAGKAPGQEELAVEPAAVASPSKETWYYSTNGQKYGPLDFNAICTQIRTGRISPHDLVWSPTMADWQPAGTIGELIPVLETYQQVANRPVSVNEAAEPEVPVNVARSLEDSCVVLMFLAVWSDIVGVLLTLACISLLAVPSHIPGPGGGSATVVALLVFLPMAALLLTVGILLHRYRGRITDMLRFRDVGRLDRALRALNSFWMFMGLIVLLLTLAAVCGILFVISAASIAS